MQLTVASPYRENAVLAIARSAAANATLRNFYTTLYLAHWQSIAQRLPLVGSRLAIELGRRTFAGIPMERIDSAATGSELVHVAARRLIGQRHPAVAAALMYRVKARFDARVAARLIRERPDAFVGMFGASQECFRSVQRYGGLAVLNFVNSHPAEHNRYLLELAGAPQRHHELIPDWVARRVEAELALADLVLVPSQFVAKQLVAHGTPMKKIAMLPYGVNLDAFFPAPARPKSPQMLTCLYVGQISHRKGIRFLLEAARHCADLALRFRLIGPVVSPELLRDLPPNVVYDGVSLPGGVPEAMRQADLFVLPTIEDACALVVLEAMACALPVVTTTNNGSGELIENGRDGLIVETGDSAALTSAFRRLVAQPDLRNALGAAARQKVQDAHSWESYGESVLAIIRGHLDARAERSGVPRAGTA